MFYNLVATVTRKGDSYLARCPELANRQNKYDVIEEGKTAEDAVRRLKKALETIAGNPDLVLDVTPVTKRG